MTVDIADELHRRLVEYGEIAESAIQFMEANRRRAARIAVIKATYLCGLPK